MADDLLQMLTRFHSETVMPDVRHAIEDAIGNQVGSLRNEILAGFDAIYHRFDRLETEYYALVAAR